MPIPVMTPKLREQEKSVRLFESSTYDSWSSRTIVTVHYVDRNGWYDASIAGFKARCGTTVYYDSDGDPEFYDKYQRCEACVKSLTGEAG